MLMIQEWDAASPRAASACMASVTERVATARARQRRRWVLRSLLMTSVTAMLLCVLVAWKRDRMTSEASLRGLQRPVAELQASIDKLSYIPVQLPQLAYRADDELRHYAMRTDSPVILAASDPIRLLLAEDGSCVVLYERGKVRAEWMTLTELRSAWRAEHQRLEAYHQQLGS